MLLAAFGYGTLPVVARFAGDAGISTAAFVTWRSVVGAAILVIAVVALIRAGRMQAPRPSRVSQFHRVQIAVVALMTILTNFALFTAFERTSIALVLICFYTFPVMVAVAAVRVYGETLTPTRVGALAQVRWRSRRAETIQQYEAERV